MTRRALFALWLSTAPLVAACGGGTPAATIAAHPDKPPGSPSAAASAAPPAVVPAPRDDGRLPTGVVPYGYQLAFDVDPAAKSFHGVARIAVNIATPTRVIVLHGRELSISHASVTPSGASSQLAAATLRPAAHSQGVSEELVLVVPNELRVGAAQIRIEYEAPLGDGMQGLYRVNAEGQAYAVTQFEPNDARGAFPCFDEPGLKVPFELSITAPHGQLAVANAPVVKQKDDADGRVTFTFAKTPPLPSYLVAFGVGPFDRLEGPQQPVPVRLVAARGKAAQGRLAVTQAAHQLEVLSRWFDRPYPYAKLDLVAVPNFAAGAMENPGFVTFREELLLVDAEHSSVSARRDSEATMAHELAHQWFGNLVTTAWWDDLWLNEGFATWMERQAIRDEPSGVSVRQQVVADNAWVMTQDALPSTRRIREPVRSTSEALEAFDGITYVKGAALLDMIEAQAGPDRFQAGVRAYLSSHAWHSATAADLYAAIATASGKDVQAVAESFAERTGVPSISATLHCDGKPRLVLEQRPYHALGAPAAAADAPPWNVPVRVRIPVGSKTVVVDAGVVTTRALVDLPTRKCPRWVYPNADDRGYYRVEITKDVRGAFKDAARLLSAPERVGLVGHAWAAVKSGELGADEFLTMLRGLRGEKDRVVWEQIITSLRGLAEIAADDATRTALAREVDALLGPPAKALGWEAKSGEPDETTLLRAALYGALGDLGTGDPQRTRAEARARRFIDHPDTLTADVARVAVPWAAHQMDDKLFNALVARVRAPRSPADRLIAISGLVSFEAPARVERALGFALDGTFQVQDFRYVFRPLFARPVTRAPAWAWVKRHLPELAARLPAFTLGSLAWLMASFCDEAGLAEAEATLRAALAGREGTARDLALAAESGHLCVAVAKEQAPRLSQALAGAKR